MNSVLNGDRLRIRTDGAAGLLRVLLRDWCRVGIAALHHDSDYRSEDAPVKYYLLRRTKY
ncbi:hypothetical protein CKO20_07570 [Rhodocyclus tenuis]|nr:hypothetical protein [Rhodocyclus tenuis]